MVIYKKIDAKEASMCQEIHDLFEAVTWINEKAINFPPNKHIAAVALLKELDRRRTIYQRVEMGRNYEKATRATLVRNAERLLEL